MNMKKLLTITILTIFLIGMVIGGADASHTFKKGGYKMTVSNKQYYKIKHVKDYGVVKKVGTKKQWKTVKILANKRIATYTKYRTYYYNTKKINKLWTNKNAKYIGTDVDYYHQNGVWYYKSYAIFKVKKTVNIYMRVGNLYRELHDFMGYNKKKAMKTRIDLGTTKYFCY